MLTTIVVAALSIALALGAGAPVNPAPSGPPPATSGTDFSSGGPPG